MATEQRSIFWAKRFDFDAVLLPVPTNNLKSGLPPDKKVHLFAVQLVWSRKTALRAIFPSTVGAQRKRGHSCKGVDLNYLSAQAAAQRQRTHICPKDGLWFPRMRWRAPPSRSSRKPRGSVSQSAHWEVSLTSPCSRLGLASAWWGSFLNLFGLTWVVLELM